MTRKALLLILTVIFSIVLLMSGCTGREAKSDSVMMEKGAPVERIDDVKAIEALQKIPGAGPYSSVSIGSFIISDELQKEYPEIMGQFTTGLLERLKETEAFDSVVGAGEQATGAGIKVEGEIMDLRIVSDAARIIGGTLAGSSYMDVFVKLTDIETGRLLDQKIISSNSNPFGAYWSGGESDRSLPNDMGKIIGEYVYRVAPAGK